MKPKPGAFKRYGATAFQRGPPPTVLSCARTSRTSACVLAGHRKRIHPSRLITSLSPASSTRGLNRLHICLFALSGTSSSKEIKATEMRLAHVDDCNPRDEPLPSSFPRHDPPRLGALRPAGAPRSDSRSPPPNSSSAQGDTLRVAAQMRVKNK